MLYKGGGEAAVVSLSDFENGAQLRGAGIQRALPVACDVLILCEERAG
jgi:hypothetical protein